MGPERGECSRRVGDNRLQSQGTTVINQTQCRPPRAPTPTARHAATTARHSPALLAQHAPPPTTRHAPAPMARHTLAPTARNAPAPVARHTPAPTTQHAPAPTARHATTSMARHATTSMTQHALAPTARQAPTPTTRQAPAPTTRQAPAPTTSTRQAPAPTTSTRQAPAPTTSTRQAPAPTMSTRQAPAPTTLTRQAPAPTAQHTPAPMARHAPTPTIQHASTPMAPQGHHTPTPTTRHSVCATDLGDVACGDRHGLETEHGGSSQMQRGGRSSRAGMDAVRSNAGGGGGSSIHRCINRGTPNQVIHSSRQVGMKINSRQAQSQGTCSQQDLVVKNRHDRVENGRGSVAHNGGPPDNRPQNRSSTTSNRFPEWGASSNLQERYTLSDERSPPVEWQFDVIALSQMKGAAMRQVHAAWRIDCIANRMWERQKDRLREEGIPDLPEDMEPCMEMIYAHWVNSKFSTELWDKLELIVPDVNRDGGLSDPESESEDETEKRKLPSSKQAANVAKIAAEKRKEMIRDDEERLRREQDLDAYRIADDGSGRRVLKPTIYCSNNGKPPKSARKSIAIRVRKAVEKVWPNPMTLVRWQTPEFADQEAECIADIRSYWENGITISAAHLHKKIVRRLEARRSSTRKLVKESVDDKGEYVKPVSIETHVWEQAKLELEAEPGSDIHKRMTMAEAAWTSTNKPRVTNRLGQGYYEGFEERFERALGRLPTEEEAVAAFIVGSKNVMRRVQNGRPLYRKSEQALINKMKELEDLQNEDALQADDAPPTMDTELVREEQPQDHRGENEDHSNPDQAPLSPHEEHSNGEHEARDTLVDSDETCLDSDETCLDSDSTHLENEDISQGQEQLMEEHDKHEHEEQQHMEESQEWQEHVEHEHEEEQHMEESQAWQNNMEHEPVEDVQDLSGQPLKGSHSTPPSTATLSYQVEVTVTGAPATITPQLAGEERPGNRISSGREILRNGKRGHVADGKAVSKVKKMKGNGLQDSNVPAWRQIIKNMPRIQLSQLSSKDLVDEDASTKDDGTSATRTQDVMKAPNFIEESALRSFSLDAAYDLAPGSEWTEPNEGSNESLQLNNTHGPPHNTMDTQENLLGAEILTNLRQTSPPTAKRGRGRPKGSTNKQKKGTKTSGMSSTEDDGSHRRSQRFSQRNATEL